jgi:hypothetical protein
MRSRSTKSGTRTDAGGEAVQRRAGKRSLVQKRYGAESSQPRPAEAIHSDAQRGVAGAGSEYPHKATIESSLGMPIDARAHTGAEADWACAAIDAEAYATGNEVAFGRARAGTPDLHTAAHEAVHTVQQAHGVQLKGGVGEAGDSYEQQADRIADAVVAGTPVSGEDLASLAPAAGGRGAVQRQAVQRIGPEDAPAAGQTDAASAPQAPPAERIHVVVRGDTLSGIARRFLGSAQRWRELYAANRAAVGSNPDLIHPGLRLVIPGPAPAQGGDAGADAVCMPPGFPHVVLAAGTAVGAAELIDAELRVGTLLESWRFPFDNSAITIHTYYEGSSAVVLRWQPEWGEITTSRDYAGSLSPLEARLAVAAAVGSDGWPQVSPELAAPLRALLGGELNPLSAAARASFHVYYADSWDAQPPETQALVLEELLTSSDARPALTGAVETEPQAEYTLAGPTLVANHQFRGVQADADRWDMQVDERAVTIWAPHAPSAAQGFFHSAQQAAIGVASLPRANRILVNTVTLNAVQNPDDAFWATEYNTPNFRSYMTAGSGGDVTIYPSTAAHSQDSMSSDMIHETGHTWSHQQWGESTDDPRWQPWKDAIASDRISVSNYAAGAVAEDVAETIQIYAGYKGRPEHDEYRAMVPARFLILDEHF